MAGCFWLAVLRQFRAGYAVASISIPPLCGPLTATWSDLRRALQACGGDPCGREAPAQSGPSARASVGCVLSQATSVSGRPPGAARSSRWRRECEPLARSAQGCTEDSPCFDAPAIANIIKHDSLQFYEVLCCAVLCCVCRRLGQFVWSVFESVTGQPARRQNPSATGSSAC